jgi:precorrin-4 methylase
MHVMMQATIFMFFVFKIINDVMHDLIKANYVEAPFKIILKVSLPHLQELVDNLNLLDLAN